jgi:hypothetical protein
LEEEQGVNILFLAVGFLRWFEDERSEIAREAPLLLIPVALTRDNARSTFRLVVREDDLAPNLPLQERLKDFGIDLPGIPASEDWVPTRYFASVRRAIGAQPRWSLDERGIMLGFFSFSKFLMFRDLEHSSWPDDALLNHPIIAGLLANGLPSEEALFPNDTSLDEIFDPGDLIQILDADSSQTLVIETARRGKNLVVQGPPGTGKSQTIANLIAAAVYDGKRVLFVAEKMAALNVVYDRLVKAGLQNVCLELHSRQANKRAVLKEIERTLRATSSGTPGTQNIERLRAVQSYLNQTSTRLHTPLRPSGVTPYRALGQQVKLIGEGYPPPTVQIPEAADLTETSAREIAEQIDRLAALTESYGPKNVHPWRGVTSLHLQPADRMRLDGKITSLTSKTAATCAMLSKVAGKLGFSSEQPLGQLADVIRLLETIAKAPAVPRDLLRSVAVASDLRRLSQTIASVNAATGILSTLGRSFLQTAWKLDFSSIRPGIESGLNSWIARIRRPYRHASRTLASVLAVPIPRHASHRLNLIDSLLQVKQLCGAIERNNQFCRTTLGNAWRGLRTDTAVVSQAVDWLGRVRASPIRPDPIRCIGFNSESVNRIAAVLEAHVREVRINFEEVVAVLRLDLRRAFGVNAVEEVPLSKLAETAKSWHASPERFDEWVRLATADRALRHSCAEQLAELLATGQLQPDCAVGEFQFARAEALWKMAVSDDVKLAEMNGQERSRFVSEFVKLEQARRQIVAQEVQARHRAGIPFGGAAGMPVIRGEIARQRGHMPIRKLIQRAGRTLQTIKPVFLMSPLSVAQFLEPGAIKFDLLIVDEASQVRPEDALGVIARAEQVVVVGDKHQLPPTSFFDRLVDDHDDEKEDAEDDVAESVPLFGAATVTAPESILTLCEARGMPGRMLSWHYRSRHPSLIQVSNAEFYESGLFLVPSPHPKPEEMGLMFQRVDGAYDRGGTRTNEIEAKAVVEAIARHVQATPDFSLGVATFSVNQRDLIDDLLETKRRQNRDLDDFLANPATEPFFIKNLENVQGDERDAIIVSIGYGPRTPGGRLDSMQFGPVSAEGGERRLNVLFTRARVRCDVFVSFNYGDIDLARTTKQGARVLKRYLQFAETGRLDLAAPIGGEPQSAFEEAVARTISELGFSADAQVGSAGFKIDLAVKHPTKPGSYVLAVECDGATYHSARWARERDRLRQELLENLGWSFHRIWSTDWFHQPAKERQKLYEAMALAVARH